MTFREADAAMRACVDAAPVIDGRRANCNLASLGVQRSKPSTPNKLGMHHLFQFNYWFSFVDKVVLLASLLFHVEFEISCFLHT